MAKQTLKQIRENTRNEVASQFRRKVDNLRALLKSKNEEIVRLQELIHKTSEELFELKAKQEMQEDWIERMQDFCNMTDVDRKEFLEQQRSKHRLDKSMNHVMSIFGNVFCL